MMICSCSLTWITVYRGYSLFSVLCIQTQKEVHPGESSLLHRTKGQRGCKRATESIFAEGEPWEASGDPGLLHIAHPQLLWSWADTEDTFKLSCPMPASDHPTPAVLSWEGGNQEHFPAVIILSNVRQDHKKALHKKDIYLLIAPILFQTGLYTM